MTSKKNISKISVIVVSIALLAGLFLDSLPQLFQTVVAQAQNSNKSISDNQVINKIPAQGAKANPGTNTVYLYQQLLASLATPGTQGTSTNGGTKTLPGIPNSVAFPAGSQLVDFDFLHGFVIVRLGPQGGPNLPLPSNADIRFSPDSKPIGVVCPMEFPCGQMISQLASAGGSIPQSAATGVQPGIPDAATSMPAKSGPTGLGTIATAARAVPDGPGTTTTTTATVPVTGGPDGPGTTTTTTATPASTQNAGCKPNQSCSLPNDIDLPPLPTIDPIFNKVCSDVTNVVCGGIATYVCVGTSPVRATGELLKQVLDALKKNPYEGIGCGTAVGYACNKITDAMFCNPNLTIPQLDPDICARLQASHPGCDNDSTAESESIDESILIEDVNTDPAATKPEPTTDKTTPPPAEPSGCNPATRSCIPAPVAPVGTTTTNVPVSPANTPAASGNIGGLGAQITAGETSITPAPILSEPQPRLPPQTNIIDGLDPSSSDLTEKQLTELFGESVTSMKPDSGSNSDSSRDQKTIIIEKETVEETVDGGMPDGDSEQENTQPEEQRSAP